MNDPMSVSRRGWFGTVCAVVLAPFAKYLPQGAVPTSKNRSGPTHDVFRYDTYERLRTPADPCVDRTTYVREYDASCRLTKLIDPPGVWTTYTFDPSGRLLSKTVPSGETIFYSDHQGRES